MKTMTMAEYQTTMEEWTFAIHTALLDLIENEGLSDREKEIVDRFSIVAGKKAGELAWKKIEYNLNKVVERKK